MLRLVAFLVVASLLLHAESASTLRDKIARRRAAVTKKKSDGESGLEGAEEAVKTIKVTGTEAVKKVTGSLNPGHLAVRLGAGGLAAAAAYKGYQVLSSFLAKRKSSPKSLGDGAAATKAKAIDPKAQAVDQHQPLVDILSLAGDSFMELNSTSLAPTVCSPSALQNNYVVVIFDCDAKLVESADRTARQDYFALMSNLTLSANPSVPMKTLYVPGKSNKHIMEDSALVKGCKGWNYLSSSRTALSAAKAIRAKYQVKDEELRIVILDGNQNVISENALDLLRINPRGMPWVPMSLDEIMKGGRVLSGAGSNETTTLEAGSPIAVYFSASWCAPCKKFSPKLAAQYSAAAKLAGTEVIFVSLDTEEDQFHQYRASMPWPAVPFVDPRRALLQLALGVKSIPALVLLDGKGKVITSSGVTQFINDEKLERFPWGSDVLDLDSGNGTLVEALQRGPALIALTSDDKKQDASFALTEVARLSRKPIMMPRGPREDLVFCTLGNTGKLSTAIRSLASLEGSPKDGTVLILLDLSNEQFSVVEHKNGEASSLVTKVAQVAEKYKRYELALSPIKLPQTDAAGEE